MSINETIRENMIQLGQEGGKGADSIIKAAMFATALVANKMVTLADGRELYLAYREGYDGEVILADKMDADKLKSQVSGFCSFMQDNVVKNGEVHGRALQILSGIKPADRKNSTYNSLIAVNRAQKKQTKALTNTQIEELLTREETEEKDAVAKLEALLKAATAIAKKFDTEAPGIHGVVASITKTIAATKELAVANAKAEASEPVVKSEPVEKVVEAPKLTVVPSTPAKEDLAVLLSTIGRVSLGNDKQAVN